jgi:hypothetical protein
MIVRLSSILNKCIYIPKNTGTYGPTEPDLCDTVRMPGLVEISNLATQHLASRKIFFSVSLGLSLVQKNQRAPIEKKITIETTVVVNSPLYRVEDTS